MSSFFLNLIFIHTPLALFLAIIIVKLYFIFFLCRKRNNLAQSAQYLWSLIVTALIGQSLVECAWIIDLYLGSLTSSFHTLSYVAFIMQYLSLTLFLKELSQKSIITSTIDKVFLIPIFIVLFFFGFQHFNGHAKSFVQDNNLYFLTELYLGIMLTLNSFIILYRNPKESQPKILNYQLKLFVYFFILPLLSIDFLLSFRIMLHLNTNLIRIFAMCSSVFTTLAFTYCLKKVMAFRFLNFSKAVSIPTQKTKFVIDFAELLKKLSRSRSPDSLQEQMVEFASTALNLPQKMVNFYMHYIDDKKDEVIKKKQEEIYRLYFPFSPLLGETMLEEKILVYDEVVFSYYYEGTTPQEKSIKFLDFIRADVYLPIYYEGQKVACLVVARNALGKHGLYSKSKQDELVMFATYIGSIYNLLQSFTIDELLKQKSWLKDELYLQNLETQYYKESIQSFLYSSSHSKIGILAYKSNAFTYITEQTKDIIGPDINTQEGSPLQSHLQKMLQKMKLSKKGEVASFSQDVQGKMILIHATQNVENKNFMFVFYYPGIIDIINYKLKLLKNPTEWDYLLYLETTKAGKVIEDYYPASNTRMVNFKINLLKASLEKRPILLDLHFDDLVPTVEMLHKISLRPYLEMVHLRSRSEANTFCAHLFGSNTIINPIPVQKSLLKKLDQEGIVYIHNIHYLSLSDQVRLTEFIQQASFSPNRSKEKHFADVRLIISSEKNLELLGKEGLFSLELLHELKKITIHLPSLLYISDQELLELTDDISTKEIKSNHYTRILSLTHAEKNRILQDKPVSWKQLELYIKGLVQQKISKNPINEESIRDPLLYSAEQLGKNALKDKKIMKSLWKKFNKNQRQIALFLGVNRSSINRRCKKYGLI